ncbi:hypothetical protein Tco_1114766 [Tanacetum coccineum]
MKTKNILEHNDTEDLEEMEPKMAGSHAYHEGKEILKEDKKKSEFQWQRNCSSSSSSSNTKVQNCSKECLESYQSLQKQFDQQRDVLNKTNLEIITYQLGLESLEARIVVYQKNEAVYEEDIAFLKYDVKIEEENNQVNDRFKKVKGYHAVPPPYTRNYMPSRPDLSFAGLDDSVYKTNVSETITSVPRNESNASKSSKDNLEQPKDVRPSAHTNLISSDTEKLQELTETHTQTTSSSRSQHTKLSRANRLLTLFKAKPASEFTITRISFQSLQMTAEISSQIQKAIDHHIPSQVDASVRNNPQLQQQDIAIWLALQMKFENLQVPQTTCRPSAVRPRDQDDPHDDAHPEGENSAKRQKTSEYEAYVSGESSSGQVNEEERGPSTLGNQEQEDDYDFWTDSYASDDDEIPTKQVSQDIMEEVSLTIDEAKLKKMADEMLRQRCTSGDEHQYHIDQMKNFLQSDIVWESRKEILVSPHPRKITPRVQSYQRDPEAPALSLINQDLLYLKKGKSSCKDLLHKETERTWKTKGNAKRANECIVSITEPDYKNLNKNDIEDMYLLIINGKVPDYAETGLLWSLSVFIRSSVIWERVHDFQLGIESYQQKVNLTVLHQQYLFQELKSTKCLKSYNNDVKYGYVQRELTNDEVEYLKLFEEEIEVRLKYRNQMRRWEMYVNGRPRRERPE